jgi:hypothetical protein
MMGHMVWFHSIDMDSLAVLLLEILCKRIPDKQGPSHKTYKNPGLLRSLLSLTFPACNISAMFGPRSILPQSRHYRVCCIRKDGLATGPVLGMDHNHKSHIESSSHSMRSGIQKGCISPGKGNHFRTIEAHLHDLRQFVQMYNIPGK